MVSTKKAPWICLIMMLCCLDCTWSQHSYSSNATFNDYARLLEDVIHSYDRRIRPVANQSQVTEIYVSFNIASLINIDEIQQEIQLNAWLNISWLDEIRTWNPFDYGGIDVIYPEPLDVWRPRIMVTNSIDKRHIFEDYYDRWSIYSTGATGWYPTTVFSLSCDLDMTYYPFDQQSCTIDFLICHNEDVVLKSSEQVVSTLDYTPNGEWDLLSYGADEAIYYVRDETCSRLRVHMVFKRRSKFYVVKFLVPVMFLSFLNFFGFVIPDDSGECISFVTTVLLSISVYMTTISGQIPTSSDSFPIIMDYTFSLLLLSGVAVIITVIHLRIQKQMSASKVDCIATSMENEKQGESPASSDDNTDRKEAAAVISIHEHIRRPIGANGKTADGNGVSFLVINNNKPKNPKLAKLDSFSHALLKVILESFTHGDFQLFLIFVATWIILTAYFLSKLM